MIKAFFGAGKIGRQMLKLWKGYGLLPDFFVDNREDPGRELLDSVRILHFSKLKESKKLDEAVFFITCRPYEEVKVQLEEAGVPEHRIRKANTLSDMLFSMGDYGQEGEAREPGRGRASRRILADLQNGIVLGGVESWVFQQMKIWERMGRKGSIITSDLQDDGIPQGSAEIIKLPYKEEESDAKRLEMCEKKIVESKPCSVVCNFPGYTFLSACLVRRRYPGEVRVVAVAHNDEQEYYDSYTRWKGEIGALLVISSRMRETFVSMGFPEEKIYNLPWNVPCERLQDRSYFTGRNPLRIGYAGRVEVLQKRMDLLLEAARKLARENVDFTLEIAGKGSYEENLRNGIIRYSLNDKVHMRGYILKKSIPDFWRRQDIAISCSDFEGHSISQVEAMAAGAVPVLTDVSGARDDVSDGENGFIVPIRSVDMLVDKILYLYRHPKRLKEMGFRAHNAIYEKQKGGGELGFWEKIWRETE